MPYETDIYDYSLKKLNDDGISFICERSFKTNETTLKYKNKDDNTVATIAFDDASLIYSDSNNWYIGATIPTIPKAEVKIELTEPKICKCCGAVLHNKVCEYCGVEYNYKEV